MSNPISNIGGVLENDRGVGSSHSGGVQLGSVMDEEWGMSSGSEHAPLEMGSSTEDTVSMVDESCEAVGGSSSEGDDAKEVYADSAEGSRKRKSRKRRREPTVEGRQWRRKAVRDGFMFDKEGRAGVDSSGTGEGVGAVKESLQACLEACALIGLPVTGKIVEFGDDDLSTTELARMVRLRMAQYVKEKSDNLKSEKGRKRLVFRNYIKVMKKLLDANKEPKKLVMWLSLYDWRVMSRVILPRTPYGAAWSVQKYMEDVRGMGEYAWAEAVWHILVEAMERYSRSWRGLFPMSEFIRGEVIPVFRPREEEMLVPTIRAFMKTDGFRDYILDRERRANELEARLKMCAAPGEARGTGHQPRGDVGEDVQSDSGLESLARVVTDLGEATAHEFNAVKGGEEDATCQTTADIPGASCDTQSMPSRMANVVAPVDDCDDIGDAPQCSELHVQPFAEVEDVGRRAVDATAMPCGEVVLVHRSPYAYIQRMQNASRITITATANSTNLRSVSTSARCSASMRMCSSRLQSWALWSSRT
ncbi:hypothetical protein Cgig2_006546 [Carnegiea gigantea]|uniref:Uncharacterized protein n=1 Tax=Carnegiea gigantea TaxID=171969 RepID=A0A9Q1JV76_9CARY|nr:hypothetical protein Cgig2_006546 [Carnegiea gigantea]